jgi:glycosyltransferase involved in cell wall biosynthesis
MPRRVLHILGDAQYAGTGIARIVSALACGIDPKEYEISACFVGQPGPLAKQFQEQGIRTQVVQWRHPHRDLIGLVRLWWILRSERFEIIHLHWGGRGVRSVVRRASNAKIVFHLHGQINERNQQQSHTFPADGADLVIAVSRAVAKLSAHANSKLVYSAADVSENRHRVRHEEIAIGTAGRLVSLKGISFLLRAVALLRTEFPRLQLEIAGTGPELSKLRAEVRQLGLEGTVKFLGWVANLQPTFARWTIFVQPSLEEGLGISILEAMAAGLPVIASAVGGIPEIVEDGKTGVLMPPANPIAIANCLRELLLNPTAGAKMGEVAAARVRDQFSSQKMVQDISAIYDELLK